MPCEVLLSHPLSRYVIFRTKSRAEQNSHRFLGLFTFACRWHASTALWATPSTMCTHFTLKPSQFGLPNAELQPAFAATSTLTNRLRRCCGDVAILLSRLLSFHNGLKPSLIFTIHVQCRHHNPRTSEHLLVAAFILVLTSSLAMTSVHRYRTAEQLEKLGLQYLHDPTNYARFLRYLGS